MTAPVLRALRFLLRASHLAGPDDLPDLVTGAAHELGATRAVAYVADYDQVLLVPLVPPGGPGGEALAIEGTLAGRAFSDVVQHTSQAGKGPVLWAPLVDGTDRVGVLQLELPHGREVDEELRADCDDVAALVADLITTRSAYGDAVEAARRRVALTVPAELQWRLLPPLTFVAPRVAVAGVLAPSSEVAGDSFDYALVGGTLHVAVLDAMGHGLEAALLASVAVATLRNARRSGQDLAETVRSIDRELAEQFGGDRFVTGIVGQLDVRTGLWRWVAAGHPPALLLRGGRVVKSLEAVVGPPLGLALLDDDVELGSERLEPGDRLLLHTDGVVEARDADGEFFGTQRLVDLVGREAAGERPVAETLRRLNLAILEHQEGSLQDDATTVIVEWLTEEPEQSTP